MPLLDYKTSEHVVQKPLGRHVLLALTEPSRPHANLAILMVYSFSVNTHHPKYKEGSETETQRLTASSRYIYIYMRICTWASSKSYMTNGIESFSQSTGMRKEATSTSFMEIVASYIGFPIRALLRPD